MVLTRGGGSIGRSGKSSKRRREEEGSRPPPPPPVINKSKPPPPVIKKSKQNLTEEEGSRRPPLANLQITAAGESGSPPPPPPPPPPNDSSPPQTGEEEEVVEPMRPIGFFFKPCDYGKGCKMQTRCFQHKFLEIIENFEDCEKRWFQEHPQFKHIFHMVTHLTRKLMGLWMLLLRTAKTDKGRQAWFVVNGVPIRYSIREHALLSGLYCHEYPENYKNLGSLRFVKNHFEDKHFVKDKVKISAEDVLRALKGMKFNGSKNRLRMAVLYFLATVLKGTSKVGAAIEPFILRMVNDLDLCKTFPWGRFTFDNSIYEIFHAAKHFKGSIQAEKASWTFPGFINPLEILAFECIPALKTAYREEVPNAHRQCPRMCKWQFKETGSSGYPLEEIYEQLGDTKDITSILVCEDIEKNLIEEVMEEGVWKDFELEDDSDVIDPIVDGWNKILVRHGGKILWEEMWKEDTQTRKTPVQLEAIDEQIPQQEHESLQQVVTRMMKLMEESFKEVNEKIELVDARLKPVEEFIKEERNRREFMDEWERNFHRNSFDVGGTSREQEELATDKTAAEEAAPAEETVTVDKVASEEVAAAEVLVVFGGGDAETVFGARTPSKSKIDKAKTKAAKKLIKRSKKSRTPRPKRKQNPSRALKYPYVPT